MRLTVRTLLAWIDGVLAPEDQQALGEKVAASGVAPALVERTKAVVGHQGLSAPSPVGRGLADDPNTAAEFLDNVLDAERLEAFERICIESDIHLADVAACHEILAEITREPGLLEPLGVAQRRKLLDMAAKHATARDEPRAARQSSGAKRSRRAPVAPDRRRAPVAAWLSAATALALLAVLGGFLAWSLTRGGRKTLKPQEIAAIEPVTPAAAATSTAAPEQAPPQPAAAVPTAAPAAAEIPREPPPDAPAAVPSPSAEDEIPILPPAGDAGSEAFVQREMPAPPSKPAAAPAVPPLPPADRRVPQGDALAIVASPPAPVMPDPTMPAAATDPALGATANDPVVEPGAGDDPSAGVSSATVGNGGPLLHRVETDGVTAWRVLAPGATLTDREDLLTPPWSHASCSVAGITINLEPNTRAVLSRDADGTPWLEIVFGRAVVAGRAADARLGLIVGGLCGVVSGVMRDPAGVEMAMDRDPGAARPHRRGTVFAGSAEKVWRQTAAAGGPAPEPLVGLPPEVLLPARSAIAWDDREPAGGVRLPPAAEPDWLRIRGGGDRIERGAARALAEKLAARPEAPVEQSLRELATDRRAENRMIAAATLALLGDYEELVSLLCAEPPAALSESQWTTLERMAVPLAIARGDNAAVKLDAAFRARGPGGMGDALVALSRGFTDNDLAAGGDATLVAGLDDDSLAVRRYAIRRLLDIVQPEERYRTIYRADRSKMLRRDGIAWWRLQLEQGRVRRGGSTLEPARPAVSPSPRDGDGDE